jgi:hypothetical protein
MLKNMQSGGNEYSGDVIEYGRDNARVDSQHGLGISAIRIRIVYYRWPSKWQVGTRVPSVEPMVLVGGVWKGVVSGRC